MDLKTISLQILGNADGAVTAMQKVETASGRMARESETATGRMMASYQKLQGAIAAIGLGYLVKEAIDAALAMERINAQFKAVTGSATLAAQELGFIGAEVNRLGLDYQSTASAYAKFMASTRNSAIEGEGARKVFVGVSEAVTAMRLSTDESNGIFLALSQMMSKGKVSAEELNGQLGERLPGALKLTADAMGMTTAELLKQMQQGKLMSADVLPKLAEMLHKTYGAAAIEAAQGGQAAINRFNRSLFETKAALGTAVIPAFTDLLTTLAPVIKSLENVIRMIQEAKIVWTGWMKSAGIVANGGALGMNWLTKAGRAEISAQLEAQGAMTAYSLQKMDARYDHTGSTAAAGSPKAAGAAGPDDKAEKAAAAAAKAAEDWRKTYADLRTEIDNLNPTMDEHARQINSAVNKYADLEQKKGADVLMLRVMKQEYLDAIETQRAYKAEQADWAQHVQYLEDSEKEHQATLQQGQTVRDSLMTAQQRYNAEVEQLDLLLGSGALGDATEEMKVYTAAVNKAKAALQTANDAALRADFDMEHENDALKYEIAAGNTDDPYMQQSIAIDERYSKEIAWLEKLAEARALTAEEEDKYWKLHERRSQEQTKLGNAAIKSDTDGFSEATKAKLNMAATYTSTVGNLMGNLASVMDTTNRDQFEAAKALNIGQAVMSTATAIMQAYAQLGPIAGSISAVGIAAVGAAQIAAIASTEYGSTSATSSSVAGFAGSSSSSATGGTSGGIGVSISTPTTSVHDSLSEEALSGLADAADSASLAIGAVADGLTTIADLFSSGQAGLAVGAAPNIGQELYESDSSFIENILPSIFGSSSWRTTSAGVHLDATSQGIFGSQWIEETKKGGWFHSDKSRTSGEALDEGFQGTLTTYLEQIKSTISRAAVAMGTETDYDSAQVEGTRIETAGRTEEEIADDLEAWFTDVANTLAGTMTGLDAYASYGESYFDAAVRLSTALQGMNENLEMIGATLIDSTLAGADAAYNLEQLMGGAEEASDAIANYFGTIFTDAEQTAQELAQAQREVSVAFAEMNAAATDTDWINWAVPETREGFRSLVEGLDLSTESGRSLFDALMDIATSFGTVVEAAEELAALQADSDNDLAIRLLRVQGDDNAADLLELQIAQQEELQEYLDNGLDTTQLLIVQQMEYAETIRETTNEMARSAAEMLETLLGGSLSTLSPHAQYEQQKIAFMQAYEDGRLGDIPELGQALLTASRAYNASGASYVADFEWVTRILAEQAGIEGDITLDAVQQQIALLDAISDNTALMVTATDTVAQLLARQSAATALDMAVGLEAANLAYDSNGDGLITIADALAYLRLAEGLPAFAAGGITSGISIAGEAGPEAVIPLPDGRTVPVRLMNGAADNRDAELLAELRELRREVVELKSHAAANVRVNQAGHTGTIKAVATGAVDRSAYNQERLRASA